MVCNLICQSFFKLRGKKALKEKTFKNNIVIFFALSDWRNTISIERFHAIPRDTKDKDISTIEIIETLRYENGNSDGNSKEQVLINENKSCTLECSVLTACLPSSSMIRRGKLTVGVMWITWTSNNKIWQSLFAFEAEPFTHSVRES